MDSQYNTPLEDHRKWIPLKNRDRLSIIRIVGICCSLLAYQMAYNINFSLANPMMGRLKLCPHIKPLVWWATPITDLVIQPFIAFYSDQSQAKLGRRRPYIIVGGLGVIIGMLLMFFCEDLSRILTPKSNSPPSNDDSPCSHTTLSQVIFIAAFIFNNIFLNVLQSPARSLVGDVVPDCQQVLGNTIGSIMYSIGAIFPNIVGGFSLGDYVHLTTEELVFISGMAIIAVAILISILTGSEEKYSGPKSEKNCFVQIYYSFKHAPKEVYRVSICFSLAWCAYFMFLVEVTDFFGDTVYGGKAMDPSLYPTYEKGVSFGMLTVAATYVIGFIYGTFQTTILEKIGIRLCFAISQIIEAVALVSIMFVPHDQKWVFFALFVTLGVSFTVFNSVPFAIVALSVLPEDMGKNMAIVNTCGCVGQQTANILIGSGVSAIFPGNKRLEIASGALFAVLSAAFTPMIVVPEQRAVLSDSMYTVDEQPLLQGTN